MEGGNNSNISLESTLDVHSSEMLVPVSQPLFQHNRQRFQGKYLPNSLRFEHDGWAAGNDVYNFNIENVSVQAGEYVVTKSTFLNSNDYKVYLLTIYDSDNKKKGNLLFIAKNSIISHDCDTCTITSDANPIITSTINGYTAKLTYDSISHTLTLTDDSSENITLTSYSLSKKYAVQVTLKDTSSATSLILNGLYLPTDINNGVYLLGTFATYENGVVNWFNDTTTCTYDTSTKLFQIITGGSTVHSETVTDDKVNNSTISTSANIACSFTDSPNVTLQEFIAFFNNVSGSALYTTVATQASDTYTFNTWSFSVFDLEHTSNYNSALLYKNLANYNSTGLSDCNEQNITYEVPVWWGISVRGLEYDISGLTVVTRAGAEVASSQISASFISSAQLVAAGLDLDNLTEIDYATVSEITAETHTADVVESATSKIQQYSGSTQRFPCNFWEHCVDKASDYGITSWLSTAWPSTMVSNTITVTYQYTVYTQGYSSRYYYYTYRGSTGYTYDVTFNAVDAGMGDYTIDSDTGRYTFVGPGNGDYEIDSVEDVTYIDNDSDETVYPGSYDKTLSSKYSTYKYTPEVKEGSVTFTLDGSWSLNDNIDTDDLFDMYAIYDVINSVRASDPSAIFTIESSDSVSKTSTSISSLYTALTLTLTLLLGDPSVNSNVNVDITSCPFYKSGTVTIKWTLNSTDDAYIPESTVTIEESSLVLKGQLSKRSLGTKASYLTKTSSSGSVSDDNDSITDGYAWIGYCCKGEVNAKLYISSDSLLTTSLSSSQFTLEARDMTDDEDDYDDETLYLNYLFKLKITQVAYVNGLNISVYLCAVNSKTYMFYGEAQTDSSGNVTSASFMPGHIMFGSLTEVNSSTLGNLYAYSIARSYESTTLDSNYAFNISITGNAAQDENDALLTYISAIDSAFSNTGLVSGNSFSDISAIEMQTNATWNASALPQFYVNGDANSSTDIGFLSEHSQGISISFGVDPADEDGSTNEVTISFVYDLCRDIFDLDSSSSSSIEYGDYTITFDLIAQDIDDSSNLTPVQVMLITYSTTATYTLSFDIPMLYATDTAWELSSFSTNTAILIYKSTETLYYKCTLNYTSNTLYIQRSTDSGVTYGTAQIINSITVTSTNGFNYVTTDTRTILAALFGVYNLSNVTITDVSSTAIELIVGSDEESISIDISTAGLLDSSAKSSMTYLYTRADEEELSTNSFAKLVTDNEYQFLRQQWNTTVDVENYWWIDDTHVLVLTKYQFILKQKASELEDYTDVTLDDWNGDVFVDIATYNRIDFLVTDTLRYFCTSAYGGASAKFITFSISANELIINVYDPLDSMSVTSHTVEFEKRSLGTALYGGSSSKLYTYSNLVYYNVLSQSKITGTCVDDNAIIGLHYDNNFNQWAIIINLLEDASVYVIQGYGFVGVNGCLTGGEIPTKYFSVTSGFTGTVESLDTLAEENAILDSDEDASLISNLNELYTLTDRIVGTESQQWYISLSLTSIVSHITYSNGTFTVQELPINNNYAVKYSSASFATSAFSDYSLNIEPFSSVFPETNALLVAMLSVLGSPMLYYFKPRISIINYLQQTLGQAAYVHYNSTSIHQSKDMTKESIVNNYSQEEADLAVDKSLEEAAASTDEVTFDRQSVKQKQSTSNPYTGVFCGLASAAVSALDWGTSKLIVNESANDPPSPPSNDGGNRKFSSMFLQNLNSMASANMALQAVSPVQTSEVTAIKTLDMFYSTSDTQQVQAGPGWVNHNFVAQCQAQSVTSVQSEVSQQRIMYILGALSVYQIQLELKALDLAYDGIASLMEATSGSAIMFGGLVAGGNTSFGMSLAYALALSGLDAARNAAEIGVELIPDLISSLGGSMQSSINIRQSKHNYDIEGKHKYGSKSECFMWPCFGISSAQTITDESVSVVTQNKSWKLELRVRDPIEYLGSSQPDFVTVAVDTTSFSQDVPYYVAMIQGAHNKVTLPEDMAYVIGTESFLPEANYKNENIGESEPVFPTAPFQDYIIDETWQIGQTASVGMTTWISCKDTKIIDGEYSNCVISDDFCGIAAPYTAIEVKRGISVDYLRPYTVTPQVLALNNTGLNCCYEEKAYHAFDGYGYRVVNWCGAPGMNKERQTWLYSFLINDRLKRSNKMPQNEYLGNFVCEPVVAVQGDYNDKVYTMITQPGEGKGLQAGTIGEDKDVRRYSIPVFSEFVNTLPAAVKTISTVTLSVIDGITSLTTNNRDLQTAYKAPTSVDFTIGKSTYRYTQEYICLLQMQSGITTTQELVPCLGLEFIGSTPYEAYFYSQETRQYYVYTGGSSIRVVELIERFRDVTGGYYDFVNQEVLMPCLATFMRLDKHVFDDEDETDNVIVPRLKDSKFIGEVWPPLETIYNTRSWYKVVSLPCGIVYQGPNRCIVNRFTLQDYMVQQIKDNYGLWQRVPRERYHPFRTYKDEYEVVNEQIGDTVKVKGWTHNPFLLVTAPIGTSENTDNMYEWQITFCWPVEMDKLYDQDNYAVVNIQAETMTPGGKVVAERPTHVFLTKELFTRTGNYGYYSFRYQSLCGAGNRERLHIWSDQFICVSSLNVNIKQITQKRTEQLTIQVDVQHMTEI